MGEAVSVSFECLPLRSVNRLDPPLDATPEQRAMHGRVKQAIAVHGTHNSYFLLDGQCRFQLTNDPNVGMLRFEFSGTVLTDSTDCKTGHVELETKLAGESCPWLTKAAVEWFTETVSRAVAVEFDRYISSGDLDRARARLQRIEAQSEAEGGFLGMYL